MKQFWWSSLFSDLLSYFGKLLLTQKSMAGQLLLNLCKEKVLQLNEILGLMKGIVLKISLICYWEVLSHQWLRRGAIACVVILLASALLFDRAVLDISNYAKNQSSNMSSQNVGLKSIFFYKMTMISKYEHVAIFPTSSTNLALYLVNVLCVLL